MQTQEAILEKNRAGSKLRERIFLQKDCNHEEMEIWRAEFLATIDGAVEITDPLQYL